MEEFVIWEASIRGEVEEVFRQLAIPLSDEPMALIHDLCDIEAQNGRMGGLLAEANSYLDKEKIFAMPPKDGEKSETDRRATMDSALSPIRLVRDRLEHLCDSIRQRLILGESILSFYRHQYAEHRVSGPDA